MFKQLIKKIVYCIRFEQEKKHEDDTHCHEKTGIFFLNFRHNFKVRITFEFLKIFNLYRRQHNVFYFYQVTIKSFTKPLKAEFFCFKK